MLYEGCILVNSRSSRSGRGVVGGSWVKWLKANLVPLFDISANIIAVHINTAKPFVVVVVVVQLRCLGGDVIIEWTRGKFIKEIFPRLCFIA